MLSPFARAIQDHPTLTAASLFALLALVALNELRHAHEKALLRRAMDPSAVAARAAPAPSMPTDQRSAGGWGVLGAAVLIGALVFYLPGVFGLSAHSPSPVAEVLTRGTYRGVVGNAAGAATLHLSYDPSATPDTVRLDLPEVGQSLTYRGELTPVSGGLSLSGPLYAGAVPVGTVQAVLEPLRAHGQASVAGVLGGSFDLRR